MEEVVRTDIIDILEEVLKILSSSWKNAANMSELSNRTIHNASIFQDEDSVSIAVLVYSLSKIVARRGDIDRKITAMIQNAKDELVQNKVEHYREQVKAIFKEISNVDKSIKLYISEVINQAEIKKGSKLYEHGISLARASELLGISQWELMNYVGKTSFIDNQNEPSDVRKRLDVARKLFGLR